MTAPGGAPGPAAGAVVEGIAALGPFFAVSTHPAGSELREPWRDMSELLHDPDVLTARVAAVRERLAASGGQSPEAVELRVAASVAHLGLAARLVSPALATAVLHGRLLAPGLAATRWQPVLGSPVPLSVSSDAFADPGPGTTPEQLAELLDRHLLDTTLRELADAMRRFTVSPHILRGNTASAVNGAAAMLTAARPQLGPRCRTLASLLLARPFLRDASTTTAEGAFRRRSCCLIYRAAPGGRGGLCGDCPLSCPPGTSGPMRPPRPRDADGGNRT